MHYVLFDSAPSSQYKVAFLMKREALNVKSIQSEYISKLSKVVKPSDCIAFSLKYNESGKAPVSLIKEYLLELLHGLNNLKIEVIYVTDSEYFKQLVGLKKVKHEYGYSHSCTIEGYDHIKVVLGVNWQVLFYNPLMQEKLDYSLTAVEGHYLGTSMFNNIVKTAYYPTTDAQIVEKLKEFIKNDTTLAIDIEAYSLKFYEAGIATITFCWNKHEGMVFPVDLKVIEPTDNKLHSLFPNAIRRNILKQFFLRYRGVSIYHNACYDIKVLVFVLFMNSIFNNYEDMIKGIEVLTRNCQDTKLIYYLCTNNTVANNLSLKDAAFPYTGNYAVDVTDISVVEPSKLMEYNLIDGLGTYYLYETYYPIMQAENQAAPYYSVFLPSIRVIIQMELVGMPLCIDTVKKVNDELVSKRNNIIADIFSLDCVKGFQDILRYEEYQAKHAEWKKKTEPLEYFNYVVFNPNSNTQLQRLIYEQLGYEVIDTTEGGNPATGNDTLKKLIHVSKSDVHTKLFQSLIDLADVSIILDNFLNAFLTKSIQHEDGWWWIHGNFNLGGTVSGRLSSSNPNLQNIPSTGSPYAKAIKSCFKAPKGWVFSGSDFASLEDRISALTTKDPNKLKVYTDGYDGHCLRAYAYFSEKMPDIDGNSVESINSIADHPVYKKYRQDSKAPTFALTYQGTWFTLVQNCGISKDEAKSIEANYHTLYVVSDNWVQDKLKQAAIDGYVTVAFGLKVRTPRIAQCIWGSSTMPYEAKAEGRTAGNALGQSYGLLNNRAAVSYQTEYWNSPYRTSILPSCHIHDAQYFLLKQDINVIHYHNDRLPFHMSWQELEEIKHDEVKISGDVELFYPSWEHKLALPAHADKNTILTLIKEHGKKFK